MSNVNVLIGHDCVYFGDNCWHALFFLTGFHSCFFIKVILIVVYTEASMASPQKHIKSGTDANTDGISHHHIVYLTVTKAKWVLAFVSFSNK